MPIGAKYSYFALDGRRLAKNIDIHCWKEVWAAYKYGLFHWKEPRTEGKTHKKEHLTGAVGAVKGDDLASRRTTQLSTALQGATSGVLVTRDNSAPGATASIKIRGVTTIGETSPLVIIDGVPGDINQVNPEDVENMSILKDAASASIYGSRAAAGVIVITTKRAKENDLSLNYNFEYGWEMPTKLPQYVGAQRFLEMVNETRYNDNNSGGWYQTYSEDQVNNWLKYHETDPDTYPVEDWQDALLYSSAPRQTHSINIAGGSKVVKTKASFRYDQTDGLYINRNYERFMLRVNNDIQINKWMEAHLDVNFSRAKSEEPHRNPMELALRATPPIYAIRWTNGMWGDVKDGENPLAMITDGGTKTTWNNRIGGKAAIDITPIKGLKISGVIAPTYNFDKIKSFVKQVPYTYANDPNTTWDLFASYVCTDGLPIDESPLFDPHDPFKNRDPRLSMTIVPFGENFLGIEFNPHPEALEVMNYKTDEMIVNNDTRAVAQYASYNGLVWKKGLDESCLENAFRTEPNRIIIRYADVLLIYAEAKIELNQIDQSVLDAMNEVRARAYGVDKSATDQYPAFTATDQKTLRSQLRMERRMEFPKEGLRYMDLIRWKLMDKVMSKKVYMMLYPSSLLIEKVVNEGDWFWPFAPDIDENGLADFTKIEATGKIAVIAQKNWDDRQYLWPIPTTEIQINPNMKQNPGY